MQYRAEIDGLRAIAVLPVILFHAGYSAFSGGFVGVDIFFVISGYLITSIILSEMEQGKFSIVNFYERRARRILPALFFVMAATLPFAWMWLIPSEFKDFSKSIVAVMLFSSNILFWQTSGYFDAALDSKPLLHTWSLAVEEQYYVLFPIFLLFAWRLGRRNLAALVLMLVVASLVLAQFTTAAEPDASFYLLPTRGWELGIGALAAIYMGRHGGIDIARTWSECLGMLGFVLIAASMVLYDEHTPFPSVYTLAPTLGTALIILYCRPATVVGWLLTRKAMVGIGLVSYSAYLWHQPLFALARQRSPHEPGLVLFTVLALVSLALGYVSWRFVEAPFRDRTRIGKHQVFGLSAAGIAIFLCIGLAGYQTDGFRARDKWDGIEHAFATQNELGSGNRFCQANRVDSPFGPQVCVIGDRSKRPDGVLWGDSYAGALMHGLNQELRRSGRAFYVVLSDGCIPVEGAWRTRKQAEFNCGATRHRQFVAAVLRDASIRTVVWTGAFSALLGQRPHEEYVIDGVPAEHASTKRRILATLEKLEDAGKQVVLIGDTPKFPAYVADYAIRRFAATGGDIHATVQKVSRPQLTRRINQADMLAEAREHAKVIDGLQLFCDAQTCSSHDAGGRLLFIDNNHISHIGSERLAREVVRQMDAPWLEDARAIAPRRLRQG